MDHLLPDPNSRRTSLPSLKHVCQFKDEELAQVDIALLNLLCAGGLPGAESLELHRYLDWLDEAARKVDFDLRRHWYRFNDNPATYHDSPGFFCCYLLLQVLQEDFGVRYNPARVRDPSFQDPKCHDPDFSDSRDLFIHGIIDGPGGTCASMPVIYVAVGRRLGYPLRLVESRGHLFFRWEDPGGKCFAIPERFNVEGAGEGIAMHLDEHYKTWPEPWTETDIAGGWYLKSLTPREELAHFLSARGDCLTDNNRLAEAAEAYGLARNLAPHDARYHAISAMTNRRVEAELEWVFARAEQHRLNRERFLTLIGPQQQVVRPAFDAGHGAACECAPCRSKRRGPKAEIAVNHGPSCQCFNCLKAREESSHQRRALGHPPGCPCIQCRPNPAGAVFPGQRSTRIGFR